jgi:hypothetical protein
MLVLLNVLNVWLDPAGAPPFGAIRGQEAAPGQFIQ